jgi:hypothetical protein
MLLRELLSFVMSILIIEGASLSIERRQGGCEDLGNYPQYTGPCETESKSRYGSVSGCVRS